MARRADKGQYKFLASMATLARHWEGADPHEFGLTHEQVQLLLDSQQAAQSAFVWSLQAHALARAATLQKDMALNDLRRVFGALSETIDGTAKARGDRSVYASARIAPPAPSAPRPAPPPPEMKEYKVRNDGSILVKYNIKGDGLGGLVYEVRRSIVQLNGTSTPWETMAVVAAKRYHDQHVPSKVLEVCYQVRALRTNGRSSDWSGAITVPFGTRPTGPSIAGTPAGEAGQNAGKAAGKAAGKGAGENAGTKIAKGDHTAA